MRGHVVAFLALLATGGCDAIAIDMGGPDGGAAGQGGNAGGTTVLPAGSCGLEAPAFCEPFDSVALGGRAGDLDERRFAFSRVGRRDQDFWFREPAHTYTDSPADEARCEGPCAFEATFCGEPFSGILPPDDVAICEGQLNETLDDSGYLSINSLRIRQPFDFADRTGIVAWDVDAKVNPIGDHGWWIEAWVTEDAAPAPHDERIAEVGSPRSGVGFTWSSGADCPSTESAWLNALDAVHVVNDYQATTTLFYQAPLEQAEERCFSVADRSLNHFELRISQERTEL